MKGISNSSRHHTNRAAYLSSMIDAVLHPCFFRKMLKEETRNYTLAPKVQAIHSRSSD